MNDIEKNNDDHTIKYINTDEYVKNFCNELKNSIKTYFLQGPWGSGKTEYLKKVKEDLSNEYNFIDLELWKPKDKKTFAETLFSVTNKKLYIFLEILKPFAYIFSIIFTIFSLFFKVDIYNNIFLLLFVIYVLYLIIYSVFKFFNLNTDLYFMKISLFTLKSKVWNLQLKEKKRKNSYY